MKPDFGAFLPTSSAPPCAFHADTFLVPTPAACASTLPQPGAAAAALGLESHFLDLALLASGHRTTFGFHSLGACCSCSRSLPAASAAADASSLPTHAAAAVVARSIAFVLLPAASLSADASSQSVDAVGLVGLVAQSTAFVALLPDTFGSAGASSHLKDVVALVARNTVSDALSPTPCPSAAVPQLVSDTAAADVFGKVAVLASFEDRENVGSHDHGIAPQQRV